MDENNVELLRKYEKEKQDKINSQYNWTNYLSDNIILNNDLNSFHFNDIQERYKNEFQDSDFSGEDYLYLNSLNFNTINDNQIRDIFKNTILHSKTNTFYIGINIFNKRNYLLGNNVDKQLLFSIFNPEFVEDSSGILFKNSKIDETLFSDNEEDDNDDTKKSEKNTSEDTELFGGNKKSVIINSFF